MFRPTGVAIWLWSECKRAIVLTAIGLLVGAALVGWAITLSGCFTTINIYNPQATGVEVNKPATQPDKSK